jgi:biotin carboxylase
MFYFWKSRKHVPDVIISIGAGKKQIPLIKEIKNAGFNVIGIDINSNAEGLRICDLKIQESVFNHSKIYEKIHEFIIDGKIRGVLTGSYGNAVLTTAILNERMGIPYIPVSNTVDLIDKKRQKQNLIHHKIKTPAFHIVSNVDQIKNYPCIIKPTSGHAKSGVSLLFDKNDTMIYFNKNAFNNSFIVENYIEGDEIIAIGIVVNSVFILLEMTDKTTVSKTEFIDIRHVAPSRRIEAWDIIENVGQSIVDAFSIMNSPLIMEIRFDKNNKPWVIEAVPEFGGEYIAEYILIYRSKYNIYKQMINAIIGKDVEKPSKRSHRKSLIVQYITKTDGILSYNKKATSKKMKNVIHSEIWKMPGDEVHTPRTNHDRIGVVIAKGKNTDVTQKIVERIIDNYKIEVKKIRKTKKK